MSERGETIIDFSSDADKQKLWKTLRNLAGKHRVKLVRFRPRRSDRQNRYYWPCFVQPFAAFLNDQDVATDEEAHEILKNQFLRITRVDQKTGVRFERVRSTTELTTVEFNEYLDRCAAFLANYCGIVVPDPSQYHEREEVRRAS